MMYLTQIISFTLTRGMKLYNYDTNNFCTDCPPYSPAPIIIMSNTESLVFLLLQADDDDCAFAELKKYFHILSHFRKLSFKFAFESDHIPIKFWPSNLILTGHNLLTSSSTFLTTTAGQLQWPISKV